MTITESSSIDSIRVTESGHLEVRRADRVLRGDQEIAKTYHRHVLAPGDDLAGQDKRVAAIATAAWTPEVIAAHEERLAADEARRAELDERAKATEISQATEVKTDA